MLKFILIFLLIQTVQPDAIFDNQDQGDPNGIKNPVLAEILADRSIKKLQKRYIQTLDKLMSKAMKKYHKKLPQVSFENSTPQIQSDAQSFDFSNDKQQDVSLLTMINIFFCIKN